MTAAVRMPIIIACAHAGAVAVAVRIPLYSTNETGPRSGCAGGRGSTTVPLLQCSTAHAGTAYRSSGQLSPARSSHRLLWKKRNQTHTYTGPCVLVALHLPTPHEGTSIRIGRTQKTSYLPKNPIRRSEMHRNNSLTPPNLPNSRQYCVHSHHFPHHLITFPIRANSTALADSTTHHNAVKIPTVALCQLLVQ